VASGNNSSAQRIYMRRAAHSVAIIGLVLAGMVTVNLLACGPIQIEEAPTVSTPSDSLEASLLKPVLDPYATRRLRGRSNVRAEPSTSAEIVATLDAGRSVGLLSLDGGWYRIVSDSVVGWIWAPLVNMTDADRWEAAISYSVKKLEHDSLFVTKYVKDRALVISLDIAWRSLSEMRKLQIVSATGEVWRRACRQMKIDPALEIRFISNNDIQMARWHAFWGPEVMH